MASSSMLYDMTMCAACGKKDAHSRCTRCLQAAYCDEKCQGVHWRAGHKRECKKKTDPDASTPGAVTSAGTADTASHQRAGDDLALTVSTAAATATSTHHECPICLDNPDTFDDRGSDGACSSASSAASSFAARAKSNLRPRVVVSAQHAGPRSMCRTERNSGGFTSWCTHVLRAATHPLPSSTLV